MTAARIMIVENDAVAATELAQRIEALGYEIAAAVDSGSDVSAIAAKEKPDVILLTPSLPGEPGGVEIARRLHDAINAPIIYLAAPPELRRLPLSELPLASSFIIKPARADVLFSAIEHALQFRRTAQALTRTTQLYRESLEDRVVTERLARLGSWSQDLATGALRISPECLRIHELDEQAACPAFSALWAHVHPVDRERLEELVRGAHDDGRPFVTEYRVSLRAGGERLVQNRALVSRNGHRRLIATVQDITEQKHAEEALRQSQARASRLLHERDFILENSRDVLYYIDKHGLLFYVSPVVEQITGYPPEEWEGDFSRHFIDSPRTRRAIKRTFDTLRTGREYPPTVLEFRKKDGGTLYGEVNERPIIKDGEVLGVVGVARDVTERLQFELRLRQAAAVFENTLEAIMITDPDRCITAVNRAFVEITGYAEPEILGRNADFIGAQDESNDVRANLWNIVNETGRWSGEMWRRRKSGEVFPAWVTASTIKNHARKITHYVIVMSDLSRLKESEKKLDWLAHYDPLTRLPNRLLFGSLLAYAIRRAERERKLLAVMFVDLDNFKTINDTRGHSIGDRLLQEVGGRLSGCLRKEDTVARLSGDEFVIILEDVEDARFLADVAGKILASVSRPYMLDGEEAEITASVGISLFPQDGRDATRLVQNADAAMYRAKERGGGHFQFYTPELTISAVERGTLGRALRAGLQRREFVLYYQPQFSTDTGTVVGVEALVRWQDPKRGLVLPDAFIALGEETGLILPLGDWVLETACHQIRDWLDGGAAPIALAVNISPRQLAGDNALVDKVAATLLKTRVSPASLQLEITESAIMRNAEDVGNVIRGLKSLGVNIVIDDFGTGYSSLRHLKRFSIDKLKIDRSFVRDITYDADDRAVAEAIIGLGKSLRVKVIAEGVESAEQRSCLRELGCDEMQGVLFSSPLPEHECRRLLPRAS